MKIHIQNTDKIVTYNDLPARVWEGHTDGGIPVIAFITRIAAERTEDLAEFERDLQETAPPSADVQAWPARMLLVDEELGEHDDVYAPHPADQAGAP